MVVGAEGIAAAAVVGIVVKTGVVDAVVPLVEMNGGTSQNEGFTLFL